jgi:hypothetical protein
MGERTAVVDVSGNHEESILRWARHLGTNKIRRRLFNVVYGRGAKPRSKKQLMSAAGIRSSGAQQAQNEVDYLAKHHLIVKVENDGSVSDGSRYLYRKDPTVRANRAEIIRYADNHKAASKVPTKRRPLVRGNLPIRTTITHQTLRARQKLDVLYLTSNPGKRNSLRVEAEMRHVQEAIRRSKYRDNVALHYRPAADLNSLIDGLNDHRPRIVHFSGHGNSSGVAFDRGRVARHSAQFVTFGLLSRALSATDTPADVVVINACESAGARKTLLPPAKALVVMRETVSDQAAGAFAVRFYAAIAGGQSLNAAFQQGKVALEAVSINEADTPQLLLGKGVDPKKLILT